MVGMGAAAVSAGAGLIGSVASGLFGQSSARRAWKTQKKMLQRQYQYTMQDLKKAGLNPMLVMGNGANKAGPAAMAPTPDFASPLANSARYLKTGHEKKLLKAQEEASLASAQEIKARAKVAENEALKSSLVAQHWLKDSGLSSAAAYREAYGRGFTGDIVTGGQGIVSTLSQQLSNFLNPRVKAAHERKSSSKSAPKSAPKKQSGIATRKQHTQYQSRKRTNSRTY